MSDSLFPGESVPSRSDLGDVSKAKATALRTTRTVLISGVLILNVVA